MRRFTVLLLLTPAAALTLTATIRAQSRPRTTTRVVGRVVDQTRHLIPGVEVLVNGADVRSMTNASGVFQLQIVPSDSTVGFRRIGYRPLVVRIDPLPPVDDTLLVQLESVPIQLSEITIVGRATKPLRYAGTTKYDEVFHRHKLGLGTLVTRDEIDFRLGVHTYELLQTIPGVRIWNGPPKRIRFARCQESGGSGGVSVFIDGVLQMESERTSGLGEEPAVEMLSRINPADIEMIEVYRGASEIPAVFHWNGCAVIAIWTKWNND